MRSEENVTLHEHDVMTEGEDDRGLLDALDGLLQLVRLEVKVDGKQPDLDLEQPRLVRASPDAVRGQRGGHLGYGRLDARSSYTLRVYRYYKYIYIKYKYVCLAYYLHLGRPTRFCCNSDLPIYKF